MSDAASPWTYDDSNIFARILRGEIPNRTVMDSAYTLAFHDIAPQAPVHVLVIPKGAYVDFAHFAARASDAEIADFHRTCARLCEELGLTAPGYRAITNSGAHGHQDVPHSTCTCWAGGRWGRCW
ncbi:MAG: HIT domain-containing protein [Paracoccaceae bacterium]